LISSSVDVIALRFGSGMLLTTSYIAGFSLRTFAAYCWGLSFGFG